MRLKVLILVALSESDLPYCSNKEAHRPQDQGIVLDHRETFPVVTDQQGAHLQSDSKAGMDLRH